MPNPETIRLSDFLKQQGLVGTGGEAKLRIQGGEVRVNGDIETRRRRQLVAGDVVELADQSVQVSDDFGDDFGGGEPRSDDSRNSENG